MNGSIIINMQTLNVVYYHNSSRKHYPLEIDNRFSTLVKPKNEFEKQIEELEAAGATRTYKESWVSVYSKDILLCVLSK